MANAKNNIERFNQLATKDDIKASEERLTKRFDKKLDVLLTVVDGIAKSFDDHKIEHDSNIAAHDRMQKDINEVRVHVKMKIKSKVI
jgi:hypothetical protein